MFTFVVFAVSVQIKDFGVEGLEPPTLLGPSEAAYHLVYTPITIKKDG